MAECGATIQYAPGPEFICALPAGHKDCHVDGPVTWMRSIADAAPWKWPY